jgi:outer membrane protein assembly factor BamA
MFANLLLGIGLIAALSTNAQAQDPAAVEKIDQKIASVAADTASNTSSTVVLPVLGYTPDTGLMLGGLALRFFYLEPDLPDARPSVFSPTVIYTLKNQLMVYLGTSLNWDENRNALNVVPYYLNFPDSFYGTGRDVSLDNEEDYTNEGLGLDLDFNRKVWRNWRLGTSYRLEKHRLAEIEPDGILASGAINGTQNAWLSAFGPTVSLDSRDNTWAPDRGWWLQVTARFAGRDLGSAYTYQEYTLDLRKYWQMSDKLVLAGQYLTTRLEGDPPFFILPRLGGDSGLRGYRGGLYMDKTRAMGRFELRRTGLWGRLGAVAFAGMGDVASAPQKLTLAGELWSAGFGFRYMLDQKERVNLRVDIGFGNGDSGFFLSLGEAF